ncbi:acetyl-CoA carboxylase carboxyl transferase subunit alpha/beta [Streptomyces albus]|uniref:carboxyl transferase domain-containing protein n=1 Tax=Streptomyces albus TaxID=1888 RepID=UPI0013B49A63|nr:carboxyl transferase domain-containing protein [Streptomyces albus]QID35672.1 acetyl-CoA carboxylase carboxyl transferase subunit alpha/beta [Streptomyces albus]
MTPTGPDGARGDGGGRSTASARDVLAQVADHFREFETGPPATPEPPDGPLGWPGYDAARARARERTGEQESVVCGTGRIGAREAVLLSFEFGFLGGSLGARTGDLVETAHERARRLRLPVVTLVATGGSRMQEGMRALSQLQRVARQTALTRAAGLPQLAVVRDPTTGGGWATLAAGADIVLGLPGAQVAFAGSRVRPPDADPAAYTAEAQYAAGHLDQLVPAHELARTLAHWLTLLTAGPRHAPDGTPAPPEPAPVPHAMTRGRHLGEESGPHLGEEGAEAPPRRRGERAEALPSGAGAHTVGPAPVPGAPTAAPPSGAGAHTVGPAPVSGTPTTAPPSGAGTPAGAAPPPGPGVRATASPPGAEGSAGEGPPGPAGEHPAPEVRATASPPGSGPSAPDAPAGTDRAAAEPQTGDGPHASVEGTYAAVAPGSGMAAVARARAAGRPRAAAYLDAYFDSREEIRPPGCAAALIPVLTLIDTPGAANGPDAEAAGAGPAIAETFAAVAESPVPVTSLLIGEGGSGGALALAAPGRLWVTPDSYFSVIAPESAAAILKRDSGRVAETADALRLRPQDVVALGVARGIVPPAHHSQ